MFWNGYPKRKLRELKIEKTTMNYEIGENHHRPTLCVVKLEPGALTHKTTVTSYIYLGITLGNRGLEIEKKVGYLKPKDNAV